MAEASYSELVAELEQLIRDADRKGLTVAAAWLRHQLAIRDRDVAGTRREA